MKSSKFYTFTVPNGKSYKIPALVFKAGAVFAAAAVCFGVYAAFAFVRYNAQQQEFAEYRAHKAEYEERMQGLLDDNEKMLRDINEMATLESRLRRALIRDPPRRSRKALRLTLSPATQGRAARQNLA